MEKNKKLTIIGAIALVIALAVALTCWFLFGPKGTPGAKTLTIQVTHADASVRCFTVETEEQFLGPALLAEGLIQGEETQYGLYVLTVDGETADDTLQQWWGYTRGGEMVEYGVDMCPIADGEQYEFTLNTGW
ncbi:MAG: DUF4430 domain-containing protein [Faecousia sp.]